MADVLSKEQRKRCMSNVKGKNTKPEIMVRKYLFEHGYRYRLHRKDLPGKPDIVLPKYKTAIFINGCFWHGHKDCKYFTLPETNTEFWKSKIDSNIKRDKESHDELSKLGWKVIDIWQCNLKKDKTLTLENLIKSINNE